MKRLLSATIVVFAVVCCAVDADAFDVKNKFMISGHGGLGIPLGDFGDSEASNLDAGGARPGFAVGGSVEYGIAAQFLLGGGFTYNRFGIDEDLLWDVVSPAENVKGHWTVVEIVGLYGKYLVHTGTATRPYARAGLFLGKPSLTIDDAEGAWSGKYDMSVGLEAALGVTHFVSPQFGLGLEARFAHLDPSESDDDPVTPHEIRSAGVHGPSGVRDPGGNIQWLGINVYITYGL